MKFERLSQCGILLFIAFTVVASGCVSDNNVNDNESEFKQNQPETTEPSAKEEPKNITESSDERNQGNKANKSQSATSQTQLSYAGEKENIGVGPGDPTAIAKGPNEDYWVLANGFNEEENYVSQFRDWQETGKSHQIYQADKMITDLHHADGNWWILAGIQGEKEVFKYTENWEYTGESHEFSDDDIGSIFYDGKWNALGGPNGSTIFTYDSDWKRKDSKSIKNGSVNNYVAIHKDQNGWKALAATKNYEMVIIDFDEKWRFQDKYFLNKGTPKDLVQTEEGWWLLDFVNEEIYLYN